MSVPLYDDLSNDYDRFVNWPARLAAELPFLEAQLAAHGARRVLDVAAGTGRHAIALARAGYALTATDLSAGMIARARENAATAGVALDLAVAGFGALSGITPGPFDAVLCLGNSLPHLLDGDALSAALADMAAVLRPGGVLLVQLRNFVPVLAERQRFMPPEAHREDDREWLFFPLLRFRESLPAAIPRPAALPPGRWPLGDPPGHHAPAPVAGRPPVPRPLRRRFRRHSSLWQPPWRALRRRP